MVRRVPKSELPALARFNQLQVERFTNDVSKAIGHSHSRNNHIVQAACFFSLIRSTSPDLARARVLVEAAQAQMFRSSSGYQAAHYLPCQLLINKDQPWLLAPTTTARERLEGLFADVEHLPAAFNKADSAAESKGLRETFRALGEAALCDPRQPRKGAANRELVRRIYDQVWVAGASKAYGEAISQKTTVNEMPALQYDADGNIANLEERGEADGSREEEIRILQRYREALRTPPAELQDGKIAEIERLFIA